MPLLVMAAAAAFVIAPIKGYVSLYDEGFFITSAERALRGEIPYRDFFYQYPPGQIYLMALLYKLFGANLLTGRVYDVIVRLSIVAIVLALAWRPAGAWRASLSALGVALLVAVYGAYTYLIYPALALGMLALLLLVQFQRTGKRRFLVACGISIGFASFIRWDFGFYFAVASLAAVGSFWLLQQRSPFREPTTAQIQFADVAILAGTIAAVAVGLYTFVVLQSGVRPLFFQIFVFPNVWQRAYRWRAYPGLMPPIGFKLSPADLTTVDMGALANWVAFYFPVTLYGAIALRLAWLAFRHRLPLHAATFTVISLTVAGSFLFLQALNRYDMIHAVPMMIPLAPALAIVSKQRYFGDPRFFVRAILLLGLLGAGTVLAWYPVHRIVTVYRTMPPTGCYSTLPKAHCVAVTGNMTSAVLSIQAQTEARTPIFVGDARHDLIYMNDMAFYFLADRRPATRFHLLEPGLATTSLVQRAIITDLVVNNVKNVVLVDIPRPASGETNLGATSSSVTELDDFIRENFTPRETYTWWTIWQRIGE